MKGTIDSGRGDLAELGITQIGAIGIGEVLPCVVQISHRVTKETLPSSQKVYTPIGRDSQLKLGYILILNVDRR